MYILINKYGFKIFFHLILSNKYDKSFATNNSLLPTSKKIYLNICMIYENLQIDFCMYLSLEAQISCRRLI